MPRLRKFGGCDPAGIQGCCISHDESLVLVYSTAQRSTEQGSHESRTAEPASTTLSMTLKVLRSRYFVLGFRAPRSRGASMHADLAPRPSSVARYSVRDTKPRARSASFLVRRQPRRTSLRERVSVHDAQRIERLLRSLSSYFVQSKSEY